MKPLASNVALTADSCGKGLDVETNPRTSREDKNVS
jgi:hypothetical protein